jgi:hypothetical protein
VSPTLLLRIKRFTNVQPLERENQLKALTRLSNHFVNRMPKGELTKILKQLFPETEPFEKDGYLNTLWLSYKVNSKGKIELQKIEE